MGVSACATCDGFFYRKKVVAVVGGGDTACEEAVYLAGLASKVYLIVRKPFLRASKIMQERVMNHEKIEVLFEHNAVGLFGDNGVEGVNLVKRWGEPDEERYSLPIDGFFLAIGHQPILKSLKNTLIRTKWAISSRKVIVPVQKFPEFLRQEMLPIRIIVRLLRLREVVVKLLWKQNVIFLPKDSFNPVYIRP